MDATVCNMRLLASFVFLGMLSFPSTAGYLYYVNDSRDNSICYTNENDSTLAFVWDLNNKLIDDWTKSFSVKYSNISSSSEELDVSCYLPDYCNLWETKDFEKPRNINDGKDTFPPVLDRRWDNLPRYILKASFATVKFLEFQTEAKFHISLLSHDSAQIIFSQKENLDNGFMAVFDGWSAQHRCVLRYCPNIPTKSYPPNCTNYSDIANRPILKEGNEWILLTVLFQTNYKNFEITVEHEGKPLMKANLVNNNRNILRGKWYAGVRSHDKPVAMKLHKYSILQPIGFNGARMVRKVSVSSTSQKICLDVIYFSKNIKLTFNASILDSNQEKIIISDEELNRVDRGKAWQTRRILADNLSIGIYTIEITVIDKNTKIGGIIQCHIGPEVVNSTAKGAKSCHFLRKNDQSRKYSSEDNGLKYHEAEALCKSFGPKDCRGVKYCFNQQQCRCLSGFTGENCDIGCQRGKFGPDCHFYKNVSNCIQGNYGRYSRHTGNCLYGCVAGFRKPECLKELLVFKTGPPVTSIGAYSAQVDLTLEYENFKQTGQDVFFKEAEVQLSYEIPSAPSLQWSTVTVLNSSNFVYALRNLTPNTEYQIRSVIREWDNQTNTNVTPSVFETLPCTPRHENNTKASVDKQLNLKITNSVRDLNLCRSLKIKFLPWSKSRLMPTTIEINAETGNFPTFQLESYECNPCQLTLCRDDAGNDCFTIAYSLQDPTIDEMKNDDESNPILLIIVLVIVVLVVIIISTLAFIFWKKRQIRISQRLLKENLAPNDATDLDLVPLPERSAVRKSTLDESGQKNSHIVRVADLENYVENAMQSNLLQKQHELFPRGQTQPWVVGSDPANKKKNRYANLTAYDATRVVLDLLPDDENSHYINASYIDGYKRPMAYIGTQGPKAQTVNDFWRMIWQENVSLIIMVANVIENGKAKCEKYWPDAQKSAKYLDFNINNANEEVFADFVIRSLWLTKDGVNRKVVQMHFTTWPDHGVPLYPQSVATFVKKIDQYRTEAPITVHCSAGVGRTGTIILVDACMRMAAAEGLVDVLAILAQMRSQRANMVDNKEQYEFVHLVLLEALIVPQFELPCNTFSTEINNLMAKRKSKLNHQYAKLNEICTKEWARLQHEESEVDTTKCRFPEYIASSSQYVKIYPYSGYDKMTFINAVYVDGFRRKNQFIATQEPTAATAKDFWRMVQQNQVEQIIVLQESGKNEANFLPKMGEKFALDDLEVIAEKEFEAKNCQLNTYFIAVSGVHSGIVSVLRFLDWPLDQSCAPSVDKLVELWEETERSRASGVTVVVCHDGVTACGLFLGMGIVLEKIKLENKVDAAMATRILRQVRPSFITSQDQFEFLLTAAHTYLQAFDTYGNFQ